MAMSRKHYKKVAEIIGEARTEAMINDLAANAALRTVADNLATMFKIDNSAFQRDKFIEACGF